MHAPVAVGEIGEAQRRVGVLVAGGGHPGDGNRHVRAQHEDGAALVEHAVGGPGLCHVAAGELGLVFERGRADLAVSVALEDLLHGFGDVPQFARLVGQHVARARGIGWITRLAPCGMGGRPRVVAAPRCRALGSRGGGSGRGQDRTWRT